MSARQSQLVIVANRLPVARVKTKKGMEWKRSPGGLVSALTPFVQKTGGAWIGWTGTTGSAPDLFDFEDIKLVPVGITRGQLENFYDGFCNGTLWPLYHGAVREPEYHRSWWRPYVAVNKRYARMTAETAERGATVWVHDYHLQLVPALLREQRPDLHIGFFLHIPFPPEELFGRLPWRRQILEGLLGANVVGFQTPIGAHNFIRVCRRYTDAKSKAGTLELHGRKTQADAFPISVDVERYASAAESDIVTQRAQEIREQMGRGRRIILGVDRLDYTKGIDVRLRAFSELLSRRRQAIRDYVLVQLAVPSRERVDEYRELRSRVEELVGQINGEFGDVSHVPVHYLHRGLPFTELIALYRAADVMLVTPLADGMNLVAKEYVATRYDDTGVMILSEFAGAAQELKTALQVNPHDVDGLAETIEMALSLPQKEATRRMRKMREAIGNYTVFDWADSFVTALSH
ncbi:MAG: trehalose-6-phosphate synthase [Gemmatimonadetes bacterium]|uniref:Glucosylglycerol-phosphate synthase n=1 Tax=Candidatus Kutchimonas denitrificans TaxID=3056748 RepID=A0AAE5CD53_9BACT|nr:trehalose-6-phosphate synthase [Gemmatimonadota bacterium]NIR76620.1 trehalose-6-phosphate synthase [Candidatus Kutchimonas denitrificans]NIS03389.1 trehalose-6-phosphate synthase [Gemmatimonadota bacterium]NIT69250.1 trehalose-6-phosphate synthase [Gemmatimonadota bacterium]NIU54722.1 trehalose-6-phosphate synthase [Gemmatimonadota bacterium]